MYANDLDSQENGIVFYFIERGDMLKQFAIDEKTGIITVAEPVDRESVSIPMKYYFNLLKNSTN